jgi:hypothetical protein
MYYEYIYDANDNTFAIRLAFMLFTILSNPAINAMPNTTTKQIQ